MAPPRRRAAPHLLRILASAAVALTIALASGAASAQGVGLVGALVEPRLDAQPGEVVTVRLRFESMGPDAWSAEPVVRLPPGWVLVVPPGSVTLEPSQPRVVLLTVRVPAAAHAGTYPLRVEFHDRRTGRTHPFEASVVVPEVLRASLNLVDAPALAHDEAFEHRYLLRNDGNGDAEWLLAARATGGLGALVEPERATLAPGEAVEVVVRLSVPDSLRRSTRSVVTLTAQHARDDAVRATARGTTEVVPPAPAGGGLVHTLPLVVRVAAGARLGAGIDAPTFELRGSGPLDDRRLDHLSVHYRAPIEDPLAPEAMLLTYRRQVWTVRAGLLSLDRGGALGSVSGFGVGAAAHWSASETWRMHADVGVVAGVTPAFAATFTAVHAAAVQLEAGAFLAPGEALARFGVEHRARYDASVPVTVTRAHASYSVRAHEGGSGAAGAGAAGDGWTVGHRAAAGVRLQGSVAQGSLEQTFQSAGFDGRERHQAVTTAALGVRVDRLVGGAGWPRVDLNVSHRLTLRWAPAGPAADAAHRLAVGVRLALDGLSVGLSRVEAWSQPFDAQARSATTVAELSLRFGAGSELGQRLTWLQTYGAGNPERLDYRATAALPTGGTGRLRVQLDLGYLLEAGRLDALRVQGRWSGSVTPSVRLGVGASLRPLDARGTFEAAASGTFALGDGHTLDLGLGLALHRTAPWGASASVGYTVPLDVPVSRRTTIGTVEGRLLDHESAPVAGAVVQVAGQSAITRADGSFTVVAVPPGEQGVHVRLETLPFDYPVREPGSATSVLVVAGEARDVELRYLAGAGLDGRIVVVDDDEALGERVVGPTTEAQRWLGGALVVASNGSDSVRAVTGPGGAFRLTHLLPGTWTVTLHHPALPNDYRVGPPSVTVEVAPGAAASVTFELRPVRRTVRIQEGGVLTPLRPGQPDRPSGESDRE